MANVEIIERWADALESGEFQQGRGSLRCGDEFCCLGVLCELAVREGVIEPADQLPESHLYRYDGMTSFPTRKVCEWAGIRRDIILELDFADTFPTPILDLARMNDRRAPFADIAREIRKMFLEEGSSGVDGLDDRGSATALVRGAGGDGSGGELARPGERPAPA